MCAATVRIESGEISGVTSADGVVTAFKGIPYAWPPIGALRWRPPERAEKWSGVRACTTFGPRSIQPDRPQNSISYFGPEHESEDCLYLNVWAAAAEGERRPVMAWFHGGAYYLGSAGLPVFNGDHLARKGVVLVTINYRLGRLGFLAHPDLPRTAGSSTGNFGILDQIAALQWIKRNIAAFGGDPGNVTIFGQSAGGISCCCLMSSPLATGLFHRVIGQSGAAFGPVGETSLTGDSLQSLEHAEQSGLEFARSISATSFADLCEMPAKTLQLAARGSGDPSRVGRGAFDTSWMIVDGHVLPEAPYAIFSKGRQNDVPLLTGSTTNEGATLPAAANLAGFVSLAQEEFGASAQTYLQLFPAKDDAEAVAASRAAFSYRNFVWQNWTWANLQARTGRADVHYYRYNQTSPIPPGTTFAENSGDKLRAFHTAELAYLFGTFGIRNWPWRAEDFRLGELISTAWVNFAATGTPNTPGLPTWPTFNADEPSAMMLQTSPALKPIDDGPALEFWDKFYASRRG